VERVSATLVDMLSVSSSDSTSVVSVKPVLLQAPGRGEDLQVKVSAPTRGGDLPIVVFSHGYGWSMDGYAPLADAWAAQGFAVLQPTHLDSRTLALAPDDPRTPHIWRLRVEDVGRILDELDRIEDAVPGLSGRLARDRIAVAGHSWGAQTVGMLMGARVLDAEGRPGEDMTDPRVAAGVLLAAAGSGGKDLSPFAAEHFPFMSPDFSQMTAPALIVAGDHDQSPLTTRGPDWFTDAYHLSPGPKTLLTLFGAEHSLGGIVGPGVAETTDESPERVALIQRVTGAYLRGALHPESDAALASADPLGTFESK
jgi:fermentation-respiration switch protein FrsA (DUF1100 family)